MRLPTPFVRPPATLALAALLGLGAALAAAPPAAAETYGDGVALAEPTPIAAIVADPEAWAGKRVRVEGRVAAVCPMRGCWMELAAGEDGPVVRIKVDDGVIVFPADAAGRPAVAEGVVRVVELSREDYLGWLAHLAEERGQEFDPEAAGIGDGPFKLIQIHATGAEIAAAPPAGAAASAAAPSDPDSGAAPPAAENAPGAAPAPGSAPGSAPAGAGAPGAGAGAGTVR